MWEKPGCVQCAAVKRALNKEQVLYEVRDLSDPQHTEQLKRFIAAGHQQAPIVQTPSETFAGFQPDKITAAVTEVRSLTSSAMTGQGMSGPGLT